MGKGREMISPPKMRQKKPNLSKAEKAMILCMCKMELQLNPEAAVIDIAGRTVSGTGIE